MGEVPIARAATLKWRTALGECDPAGGNGTALRAPPGCVAELVPLTLTEDDRAALGVRNLYAAAWSTQRGVVLGTSTGDGAWRQTSAAIPRGSGPCAMTATADGVLLACTDGTAIRCRRVPLDAFIGDGGLPEAAAANWHHDSADLIATLRERQPGGHPVTAFL